MRSVPIFLHICCGVCAGAAIKRLQADGYEVTGFFYNPNIQPRQEYELRLEAARQAAALCGIRLVEGDYDEAGWLAAVKGLEHEPERGARCPACFKMRLERTLKKAQEEGIPYWTTTLTISPHKDASLINRIGRGLGSDGFKPYDFKKQDGFRLSQEFSRSNNLYRQHYCGCLFSKTS